MSDIAAIVLAAGLSLRMGASNKLLTPIGDDILVSIVVSACAAASDHPVTVVTGYQAEVIELAFHNVPIIFAHNINYKEGQMTSVDVGLRRAPKAETYLIALGDQPKITKDCLKELLEAHAAQRSQRITVPIVDGQRGNPIVVPAVLRSLMLSDPINLGCQKLTRQSPELVHEYATPNKSFIIDIDTPQDLVLAELG